MDSCGRDLEGLFVHYVDGEGLPKWKESFSEFSLRDGNQYCGLLAADGVSRRLCPDCWKKNGFEW